MCRSKGSGRINLMRPGRPREPTNWTMGYSTGGGRSVTSWWVSLCRHADAFGSDGWRTGTQSGEMSAFAGGSPSGMTDAGFSL